MKEVRVIAWCENHPDQPATSEVTASVGRQRQPRVVDVCDECVLNIVGPFIDLMDKGVTVDKVQAVQKPPSPSRAPVEDGQVPCPLCETSLATRQGLSGHLRTVHGTGIREQQRAGTMA